MCVKWYLLFIILLFSIEVTQNATALPTPYCETQSYIPSQECIALRAFYSSTYGELWTNSDGWLTDTDPCTLWHGVTCEKSLFCSQNPPICNLINRVKHLILQFNNLSGSIPTSIEKLEKLYELQLSYNNLSGSIPSEIGTLRNLLRFDLRHNQLIGIIPSEIVNLTNLWYMQLDGNQLSGSIPEEIGDLTKLRVLTIQRNQLSGSIPSSTGNLINLYSYDIGNNQLSGIIPPEIGNLTNINILRLNDNQLCGGIPTNLTNLTNLANGYGIDLDNNYLFTNDTALDAFLIQKGGEWKSSQGEICPSSFPWMPLFHIILKDKQ